MPNRPTTWLYLCLLLSSLLAPYSLAQAVKPEAHDPDPWEGFNRSMFAVNEVLDKWLLRPLAVSYNYITPKPVDRSVGHFFNNLKEPMVFASDVLQFKILDAGVDLSRFIINTSVGFFGVFDVASKLGLTSHNEDFGQVLASWGVPSGPYVVLPVLGFYTLRSLGGEIILDASGLSYINLGQNTPQKVGVFALNSIQQRAALLAQEGLISGDKYIFIRSLYLQHRAYLINDGNTPAQSLNQDDLDDDFDDDLDDDFDSDADQNTQADTKSHTQDGDFAQDDWLFDDAN